MKVVEIARRLVGEDERGPVQHGAAIGHALLLSSRQLRRVVVLAMRHLHPLEKGQGLAPGLRAIPAHVAGGEQDSLERSQPREQEEGLKDIADGGAARAGLGATPEMAHPFRAEPDLTAIRRLEQT